jgi:hypothetical protein
MKRFRLGLLAIGLLALLVSCGGRVIDDSDSAEFSPSDFLPSGTAAGSAGKAGTSRPTRPSTPFPTTKLGDCVPGFLRAEHPELPCRWLTESGMCFEETDAACACICPVDRDSFCGHGFDGGPNDAKLVLCD